MRRLVRLSSSYYQLQNSRSLNIFSIFSKEAVEKERSRLKDELNRGYFDDYRDLKKHGGKLATASQSLLPAMDSIQFPTLKVESHNGKQLILPPGQTCADEKLETSPNTEVALVCLAFRANGQGLVKPWILPFINSFKAVDNIGIYEISYVDSWFLSLAPVKWLLLRAMRSSRTECKVDRMERIFYAFGDSYEFRKSLHVTNLLTGYIFLLDKHGRVRWRAYGKSTDEEVSSMISCTSQLLDEQKNDG